MGKAGNALNHFLRDNREFADVINLCIYDGQKIIRPEDLEEAESVTFLEDCLGNLQERRNDVSKRCRNGSAYQIICLENETKIDYTMPVRGMEYEASRYREQVRRISENHRKEDFQDWNELSSRFKKTDTLYPVITLVLYWSKEPWDGPRTLEDMLNIPAREKEFLRPFLQNYKLNLINMYKLKDSDACEGQLKYILRLLKLDGDKKAIYEEVKEHPEYEKLKRETGHVLSALLGDERIEQCMESQKEKEGFNMCKALDDLWNDAKQEGRLEGRQEGRSEGKSEALSCVNKLILYLAEEDRYDDIRRAAQDTEYQKRLFVQYGLDMT